MEEKTIDERLFDYFSGNLKEAERRAVEEWIEENAENAKKFQQFRKDFWDIRWGIRGQGIQGSYRQLERRLGVRRWIRRSAWAASILILVGCLFFWQYEKERAGMELLLSEQKTVLPGKARAVLVLSSGKSVKMDSLTQELTELNGTSIQIDKEGCVCYHAATEKDTAILYNTLIVPRGGEFSMTMADGTKVWLNAETELRFPVDFSHCQERTVYLKGEAYFEVEKDQKRPFVVKAGDAAIRVYGTSFDVNHYSADRVEAVLVKGSIGLRLQDQEVQILPGQRVIADRSCSEIKLEEVDVTSYIAWKDGNFVFRNESLESILQKLARWYDMEVVFKNEAAKKCCFSGDMRRYEEINPLLYYFERISEVRFDLKGNCLYVK